MVKYWIEFFLSRLSWESRDIFRKFDQLCLYFPQTALFGAGKSGSVKQPTAIATKSGNSSNSQITVVPQIGQK
jgi:hypothetical protein